MLYGGPLGTYLSGLSTSSGTSSHGTSLSPSNTYNSSSTPTTYLGSGIRRSNSRYRSSGVSPGSTLSQSPSSSSATTGFTSLSNYYTPQLRRKYGAPETDPPKSSGRYSSRTQPRTSTSPATSSTTSPTSTSTGLFHYSRWSPSKTSSPGSYVGPSIGTSASWNADLNTVSSGGGGSSATVDYKRLYEAEKLATDELRNEVMAAQKETRELQERIETAKQSRSMSGAHQRKIERRISECEEELKTLEKLRAESEKLRAEHRALVRVVARLNREK
ncbi:hypothetical protein T265_08674 [Opisthorchis viverrini]|uniref:cGMP-dependent protein kinase interacting domain-containing protein n=1 Tax=Opisthorchis viverrini TaxID=6198 RepID=A0A074ZJC0_OPIVI|nr:hypothetical protein T265_08674 [Opisthorchis viverrini]KER23455.1 hypothetical protein T265_08674 [Opisthorchis viverrini]